MIINPIIPVWLMGIICVLFLFMKRKGTVHFIRQLFIVILLFMINLRIMVGDGNARTVAVNMDVLFVVDNTISMLAEDYDGDNRRIDAVKEDVRHIMEEFPGASFAVISFGNDVQSLIPYTIDTNMVTSAVNSLNGQATLYAKGTSFDAVAEYMEDVLDNDRDTSQIVFFISDGEITGEGKMPSFDKVKKYVDGGAVLGYGTKEGGKMRAVAFTGDDDEPEYLTYYDDDYDEHDAVSKIDEDNLEGIAKDMGVNYVHMKKQSMVNDEIEDILKNMEDTSVETDEQSTEGYKDTYYLFVIPLLFLLIYDYGYYKRKI